MNFLSSGKKSHLRVLQKKTSIASNFLKNVTPVRSKGQFEPSNKQKIDSKLKNYFQRDTCAWISFTNQWLSNFPTIVVNLLINFKNKNKFIEKQQFIYTDYDDGETVCIWCIGYVNYENDTL